MEKRFDESYKSELVKCDHFKYNKSRLEKESSLQNGNDIMCDYQSKSDRKSAKVFLKSNYKYKRRFLSNNEDVNNCHNFFFVSKIFIYNLKSASRYVRCTKMLINFPLSIFFVGIIIVLGFADMTEAGACWLKREENGKCTHMYSSNMSEEECCKHQNFAYTDRDMSDIELFFAAAIDEGAVCRSCLDSCETAKCGHGKRCVYRKGRAKCVCAPVCRSSKKNKPKTSNSSTTTSAPPVAHRNEKLEFFNFDQMIDREIHNHNDNKKSLTSISNENSEPRWRRAATNQNALNQKSNHNETDRFAPSKRRKNQRKSNLAKRQKHSTTTTTTRTIDVAALSSLFDDVEQISATTRTVKSQNQNRKSDKIVIVADSSGVAKHRSNSKVFGPEQSGTSATERSSPHQQHHSRHQYKKQQQQKQKQQRRPKHNATISATAGRRQQQSSAVTLDEKIRNGFFNHGFPYPNSDTLQIAHGRFYNPVCGTDGKTYKTECQLKKRACRRESTTLAVAYRGHCQTSCKLVRCLNNLTCVEDQYGIPHCISCTITCAQDDISSVIDPAKAVCGVDGLTYKSVCDINRLICTTGRSISVAYYGPCQDEANCNNIQCNDKQICLNDLITNKPRCISCSFKCPRKRRPQGQRYQEHKICGTNNVMYDSWCQMRRDSCNTGFYIDVKHVGACHKNLVSSKAEYT